jgi:sorbose reductase
MTVEISLKGKNALITGASSGGIGGAIAKRLAEAGANLVIISRTISDLNKLKDEIINKYNVKVYCKVCDLEKSDAIPQLIKDSIDDMEHIDIVINNAAVNYRETAFNVDLNHWDQIMNINLKGYFLVARETAKTMIENNIKGTIVNIGSELSFTGVSEGQVAYSSSKAAINQLSRVLAAEWAEKGIRVNTVIPGFTETVLVTELLNKPGYKENFEKVIPLHRLAKPENVANAVLFMASDMSAFTTGETLLVDGGYTNIRC